MNTTLVRVGLFALVALYLAPEPLLGYIGPGSGLSAVGALIAVVAGVFFAVFGFIWYPVKRLMRSNRRTEGPVAVAEERARAE
jgi:hypothetical protein